MKNEKAFKLVREELDRASMNHIKMHSTHEGYAIIKEELDELWDEIKDNNGSSHRGVSEAVQTAAMAIRYLIDLCNDTEADNHNHKINKTGPFRKVNYDHGGYSG